VAARRRQLSPNHLDKRRQIVDAAKAVMLRSGVDACSSREVARETGLTPGLIHYYFASFEEITAAAMSDLLEQIMSRLRAAGERRDDPTERFWAVVEEYVAIFAEQPGLTLLWFEWWVREARGGHISEVKRVQDGLIDLLSELLAEVGVPDAQTRARALLSYVIGVLVRHEGHPQTFEELRPEVARLSQIGELTSGQHPSTAARSA
jgi:AcrR family transcriptional regulator